MYIFVKKYINLKQKIMYQKTLWEQLRQDLKEKLIDSYNNAEKDYEYNRIMKCIDELKANTNFVEISMNTYCVLYIHTMEKKWLHPAEVFVR